MSAGPIPREAVLLSGAPLGLGVRLVRCLHRERPVLYLGRPPHSELPPDVEVFDADPLRSASALLLKDPRIAAIVHFPFGYDRRGSEESQHSQALLRFQKVLEAAERNGVPKVVLVSSAEVYGPRPENAQFLPESAPLLGSGRSPALRTLVELDMLAQAKMGRDPSLEVVILRPAHVVGSLDNPPSNYLRLGIVPTLLGYDPMMQLVHEEDLARALLLAIAPGATGAFNIAGVPPAPLSKILRLLGRRTVALPHSLLERAVKGLSWARLTEHAASELEFIRYVCMIDDARAHKELGYRARLGLEATLAAIDELRWAP